jgi:type VI secretion system lysozyme-like protein
MKHSGNFFYVSAIERLLNSSMDQVGLSLNRQKNKEECVKSVINNLSNIFNTRSHTPPKDYDTNDLTVLDFGIPDFGYLSPENIEDHAILAKRLRKAITAFEPRLTEVYIDLIKEPPDERSLVVLIRGNLKLDIHSYEVSFLSKKQYAEGNWSVYESI